MKEVMEALSELEQTIEAENKTREELGAGPVRPTTIRILGHMSLLLNESVSKRIQLFSTQDVDAHIEGDSFVVGAFKEILKAKKLEFDSLSDEIWLPNEAFYIQIFESMRLTCEILDPISALVSKAVKAPEKNLHLVRNALEVYGDELSSKLKQYGVDPATFNRVPQFKL